jgi:hypothetical protein
VERLRDGVRLALIPRFRSPLLLCLVFLLCVFVLSALFAALTSGCVFICNPVQLPLYPQIGYHMDSLDSSVDTPLVRVLTSLLDAFYS